MTNEPRVTREGIHIDQEVAEAVAIEEELDSNVVGEYRFPDPVKRRVPAMIYLALAFVVGFLFEPWVAVIPLGLALWHWGAAWPLNVDETEALATAGAAVSFPVGHTSAAIGFEGWRARPRWSVVLYSAAEPPDQRALVVVDAVDGNQVGEVYAEALPTV